jgi:pyruvate/2-oxoglutarate dehydrogenase complex dihydrolipoamide acyltransferase (E2) component
MPSPLYVPRLNNNDDTVRLNGFLVEIGAKLRKGDPVADIETDKATFTVETEEDGYVLALIGEPGSTLNVGATLAWLGAEASESAPSTNGIHTPAALKEAIEPTLKAMILLAQFGLEASAVPASGDRLTAQDVERYIKNRRLNEQRSGSRTTAAVESPEESDPSVSGERVKLTAEERGMLRTVVWQRDYAVTGYVEIPYDPAPWEPYAAELQNRHKFLMSPLLASQAWRLARAARFYPKLNSTIVDGERYQYGPVNLGFTVQSGGLLFIVVIERADELDEKTFFDRLNALQRAAMKHTLKQNETSGNTITFTSMARWQVTRHMPVLPPQTALIVAHSAPFAGAATIGATYDHRVLSGFEAVQALQAVTRIETEN